MSLLYNTNCPSKDLYRLFVNNEQELEFVVTEVPDPDLLGRSVILQLDISVDKLVKPVNSIKTEIPGAKLQSSLKKLCKIMQTFFIQV